MNWVWMIAAWVTAAVVVWACVLKRRRAAAQPADSASEGQCALCKGRSPRLSGEITARILIGMRAVGSGRAPVAYVSVDSVGPDGVGKLVIAVVNETLWTRVGEPALWAGVRDGWI